MFYFINDYEGKYLISKDGIIKSAKTGKIKALISDAKGYQRVGLCNKYLKTHKVHRLVAINFIPNPDNKPQVNHKDGNKKNNKVENLEWVTNAENSSHAYKTGLKGNVTQKQRDAAKLVLTGNTYSAIKIIDVSTGTVYDTVKNAAKANGLKRPTLSNMLTGHRKNWTNLKYYDNEF